MKKGDVFRIGNGWPSPSRRWCTREKVNCIKRYQKRTIEDCVPCIGYAADEMHRCKPGPQRYPLIEYVSPKSRQSNTAGSSATPGVGSTIFSIGYPVGAAPCNHFLICVPSENTGPDFGPSCSRWIQISPLLIEDLTVTKPLLTLNTGFSTEDKIKPFYNGKVSRRMLRFIKPHSQQNLFTLTL